MKKEKYLVHTNSIKKEQARIIQRKVLEEVSDLVMNSAGPKGSTTMILKGDSYPLYTKDGKKILENIKLFGEVEQGILDQLLQITEKIVSKVGDGTTSAIRLSYLIFLYLVEMEVDNNKNSYDIIEKFKEAKDIIIEEIKKNTKEFTPEDAYDICMISTNGNKELSNIIYNIYKKYNTGVYIDLKTSNTSDYIIKEYDGLTINRGYASPAYINRPNGECVIRNPRIYVFKDPVDTEEMIGYFTKILYTNIMKPLYSKSGELTPTVIMCPFISRDVNTQLEQLEKVMYSYDKDEVSQMSKPPICIVSNLAKYADEIADLGMLADIKPICKYIDATVQQRDIVEGKAPSIDNVEEFYGTVEEIIIDKEKTKFINPVNMFMKDEEGNYILDEEGNRVYSNSYTSLLSFLKTNLQQCIDDGEDAVTINMLKRRINSLSSSLVELYIGGVSVTDRESVKDLADDAIRNCRSAANNGVGRATNFEALLASDKLKDDESIDEEVREFINVIYYSYLDIVEDLYIKSFSDETLANEKLAESIEKEMPINLKTLEFDGKVLTSILSDITILDCIARIVTIMFTSNQILISSPMSNSINISQKKMKKKK